MDFLGVGPLELIFILLIALIIFGPNDIVRAGRTLGSFLRKVVTSEGWRAFQQASKGMRDLPTVLMREAGLEENDLRELTGVKDLEEATRGIENQISETTRGIENQISPWTTPPLKRPNNPTNLDELLPSEELDQSEVETPSSGEDTKAISEEAPAPPPGSPFSQTIDDNN